jgi:hypothetical protein
VCNARFGTSKLRAWRLWRRTQLGAGKPDAMRFVFPMPRTFSRRVNAPWRTLAAFNPQEPACN